MTANVRMIIVNESDSATLTASPVLVATLPVENLQDQTRARLARTTGLATPQYIRGDWPAQKAISAFALVRHNLTAGATLRLKLWDGHNQTGTLVYDSGDVSLGEGIPGWGTFGWGVVPWGASIFSDWPVAFATLWFTLVSALSFELQMTDSGNTAGYMEASRLFLGKYFEPLKNMSYGVDCHWEEDTEQTQTDGGTIRSDPFTPYRLWQFDLGSLTSSEIASLMQFARNTGKRSDLFVSCYPEAGGELERNHAGQVKLIEMPKMPRGSATSWSARMVLKET
jgi:hypothetical protein